MSDHGAPSSSNRFDNETPASAPHTTDPQNVLIIVFVHGFKGTDTTFGDFPERLQHILSETVEDYVTECITFPVYETKGELRDAVENFADWLTTLTVKREVANGSGGGAGKVRIFFCGHSMGGLIVADALLGLINSLPDKKAPLWPNIVGCIAFDTPFFGINPHVFKNTADTYATTARVVAKDIFGVFSGSRVEKTTKTSQTPLRTIGPPPSPPSTSGSSWVSGAYVLGGALLAGAAAGTAYYHRENLTTGYNWISDHMKYVGNLWDQKALARRVESMIEIENEFGILFQTLYVTLPPSPPQHVTSRTFIVLPPKSSPAFAHFIPASNMVTTDEIQAHMQMFSAEFNDGYYRLGLETANLIRQALMVSQSHRE